MMFESTKVKDHLDNLSRIILDLHGVNVKIKDKDQAVILLSSLLNSYDNFVDSMFYGRTTVTMNDVNDSMMSKELKRKFLVGEGRGIKSDSVGGNRGKMRF